MTLRIDRLWVSIWRFTRSVFPLSQGEEVDSRKRKPSAACRVVDSVGSKVTTVLWSEAKRDLMMRVDKYGGVSTWWHTLKGGVGLIWSHKREHSYLLQYSHSSILYEVLALTKAVPLVYANLLIVGIRTVKAGGGEKQSMKEGWGSRGGKK